MNTNTNTNIDKRKSYYLMIDTETCNAYTTIGKNGKENLCLDDSLVYDIGCAIVDKKGHIYEERSFVISETFFNELELMNTCYYAKKLPQYWDDMHNGTRIPVDIWAARRDIRALCEKYHVKAIIAHNARFDYNALNNTVRYYSKSVCRYFLPYGIEIWDTLKMCNVFAKSPSYKKFCEDNGYMTANKPPRPRKTAEVLYRYISGNTDFDEAHTGLEDVRIEAKIFAHCNKQHKKMNRLLFAPKVS